MPILHSDMVNRAFWLNRGLEFWGMNLPAGRWGGGLTFRDIAGGHHGTLSGGMGAANWVGGNRPGGWGAMDFDGINEYISMGDSDDLSFGDGFVDSPFTLSAWVFYRNGGGSGGLFPVISKYVVLSPFNGEYWLVVSGATDKLFMQCLDGSGIKRVGQTTDGTIPKNKWVFLAGSYDGSGVDAGITLYVNGQIVPSAGRGQGGSYIAMENSTASVEIASSLRASGFNSFSDGKIDDATIHSRALSSQEHRALYDESRAGYPNALRWVRRPRAKATAVGVNPTLLQVTNAYARAAA